MPKKSHTDQVYYTFLYSVWKETTPKPSKAATTKKLSFCCVCYCYNLLQWMFFIPCDNWKTLFLKKFLDTLRSLQPPFSCAPWNKWFERSLYFIFHLHNKSTMLIPKWKVPKWSSRISYFFLQKWNVFKISKTCLEACFY